MNWDDLRILDACARAGSFSKAAKELRLNHSSVSRRIKQLESDCGFTVLNRLPTGIQLTSSGQALAEMALQMASVASEARHLSGGNHGELSGVIRFQTVDATGINLLPYLKEFSQRNAGVEIELVLSQDFANLARGEADVVLRATNRPTETYVGRRVAEHALAVFGTSELLNEYPSATPLQGLPWVVWGDQRTDRWMQQNVPDARIALRVNTPYGLAQAVRAGIGVGHLACYGVARDEKFVCLRQADPELSIQVWLLAHRNVRQNRKVRLFMNFLVEKLRQDKSLIGGLVGSPRHPVGIPVASG